MLMTELDIIKIDFPLPFTNQLSDSTLFFPQGPKYFPTILNVMAKHQFKMSHPQTNIERGLLLARIGRQKYSIANGL